MERKQPISHLSYAEYQRLEEETQQKYEYHDGEIFAMAGAEPKHNAICVNTIVLISRYLTERACNVFNSDQKVRIESINRALYPDVSVVCGKLERSENDNRAITNPVLLVEVLSDSTALYDQGDKFKFYSRLSSLQEYVLISQHRVAVQTFYRAKNTDLWQISWVEGLDAFLSLQSLDLKLSMKELYLKTEDL